MFDLKSLLATVPSAVHLGVTGSSELVTTKQGERATDVLRTLREHGIEWMHNGDCINADAFLAQLWYRKFGGRIHLHPPTKSAKRAFITFAEIVEDTKEYLDRNIDIIKASGILLGLPDQPEVQRSGTWHTIRQARKKKIPRLIVWPDGTISTEGLESPIDILLKSN